IPQPDPLPTVGNRLRTCQVGSDIVPLYEIAACIRVKESDTRRAVAGYDIALPNIWPADTVIAGSFPERNPKITVAQGHSPGYVHTDVVAEQGVVIRVQGGEGDAVTMVPGDHIPLAALRAADTIVVCALRDIDPGPAIFQRSSAGGIG